MSVQVQFRRGTATEHTTFTGAVGEITVDTTDKRAVVHDGTTAGGSPLAKESEIPTLSTLGLATSSTDNAAVRFNGTSGGTQNSGVIIDDSNNITISGVGGRLSPGPTTAAAGSQMQADWTWGEAEAITNWNAKAGLWAAGKIYNGEVISKTFTSSHNSAVGQELLWPNNALFVTGTANGTNNCVNAIMSVGYAKVNNSYVSGGNDVALSDSGLTGIKLVGREIDVMFASGQTPASGSGGLFINCFNVVGCGPAIQIGGVAGSWTNGVVISSLGTSSAGLVANNGSSMGSLVNTGTSITYNQDAIVLSNNHKVRFAGTGSTHAKVYNDTNDVLRVVNGDNGTAIRDSSDASTYVLVADTGQVGIGSATPASDLSNLRGLVVRYDADAAVRSAVTNANSGASAAAQRYFATGTSNSFVSQTLLDNSGTPNFQEVGGSAVTARYSDFASHVWRSAAGAQWGLLSGGTLALGVAGATIGKASVAGSTSGVVTIQPQAVAGTYNFNLPIAAGSSGQPLLSAGGGSSPMTFGTLGAAAGGTGATALTAHGVVLGNGTSAVNVTAAGTSGQVLTSNGASADPTFENAANKSQIFGASLLTIIGGGAGTFVGTLGNTYETAVWIPMSRAVTIGRLFVITNVTAPGVGQTYTFTVRKNAVDTAVTCTISGNAATSANDTAHSVSFAAGDLFSISATSSGGSGAAVFSYSVEVSGA